MDAPRAVERWLDEGWSPWRIGFGVVALVSTGATVCGYAVHVHHPGAVWWLLGAALVVIAWSLSEMLRWRVRHNRMRTQVYNVRADLQDARRERDEARRELETAHRPAATAPTAVNPAEWIATCDESGEFPGTVLVFYLRHRFENMGARLAFGPLRCIITDPDSIRTEAIGPQLFRQYTNSVFPGAPPARPGLYRFKWQGQKSNGEWVDITSGEHEVQPPPKTGIEVVIEDEKRTPSPA